MAKASMVYVGCKIPSGIVLRGEVLSEQTGTGNDGKTITVKIWQATGEVYTLRGPQSGGGVVTANGAGITAIPKDFWDNWLIRNKNSRLVSSGMIYAAASTDAAIDASEDVKGVLTGFEQISEATSKSMGVEKAVA